MIDLLAPNVLAALAGLLGGIVLGFAARWGRFCTLGAIEDACLGGNWGRIAAWGLAIGIAVVGTFALDKAGLPLLTQSFYVNLPTSLMATVLGSFVFGLGMALVGTCGFGTLARIGGGDLKSVVTFLVMGITAYATLNGFIAYGRIFLFGEPVAVSEPASFAVWLAGVFGADLHATAFLTGLLIIAAALTSRRLRCSWRWLTTAVLVGLTITGGWAATGWLSLDAFDPYRTESFTFSAPLGEAIIYVMATTGDSINFGIGATFGVVIGAAITSLSLKHFRWEACDDAREMRRQILGGMMMGAGSVTAFGCTVGQGLTAASLLAFSAPLALVCIFLGAWLGLFLLVQGPLVLPFRNG